MIKKYDTHNNIQTENEHLNMIQLIFRSAKKLVFSNIIFNDQPYSPKLQREMINLYQFKEIEFISCHNVQKFPIDLFKDRLKILKLENCSLGSLIPENKMGVKNDFIYVIKS